MRPIEDFAGEGWIEIGPTSVRVLPGLIDAHTNRRVVTGRLVNRPRGSSRPVRSSVMASGEPRGFPPLAERIGRAAG